MLRQLWKTSIWLFLLTLPLTFFPIFFGTLGGLLFPVFFERHITANTEKYLTDVRDAASDWGVGGDAPSFRQFQDTKNDFHLTRINSNDWVSKLGFHLPVEYSDPDTFIRLDTPIDKHASLDTLMRETGCASADVLPKEQWLFLTRYEWIDLDGWNAAWDDLLRHAYTDPVLNKTGFHFAECAKTASFLCGIWNTRAPALLHFLVEDEPLREEDMDPELSYTLPPSNLRPVTVRIIELGLQDAYTGLPWTTFPSKEKQLRSIIAGDRMYEQFEPYESADELLQLRFNEYMDGLMDAPGTLLNYINEMDWWTIRNVNRPLGIDDYLGSLHGICFNVALIASSLIDGLVVRPVREVYNEFLGTPKPGDVIFADMDDEEIGGGMDDLFGFNAMFQKVLEGAEKAASESGRTAAAGTSAPPETMHSSQTARL